LNTDADADQTHFADVLPLCLLALQLFYGTGHQSVLQSAEWKTAFLRTVKVVYPLSPPTLLLNLFGSLLLIGVSLPLLAAWNVSPSHPYKDKLSLVNRESLRTCLATMTYFSCLSLASTASAAWHRRHSMVWKVFAPRFIVGAAELMAIDLGIILGIGWGVPGVFEKVHSFARASQKIWLA